MLSALRRRAASDVAVVGVVLASVLAACSVDADVEPVGAELTELDGAAASEPDPDFEPDSRPDAGPDSEPEPEPEPESESEPGTESVPDPEEEEGSAELSTGLGDRLFPELGARPLDVERYEVLLDFGDDPRSLRGRVAAQVRFREPVAEFALDAVDLDVSAVTVGGEPAEFSTERVDGELVISAPQTIAAGETHEVIVEYEAEPQAQFSEIGFRIGWFADDDHAFALNEPDAARRWLPLNDHPSDKATWQFDLVLDAGTAPTAELEAIANGELLGVFEELLDGREVRRWRWDMPDPMATYLAQVIVGDYEIVEREPYVSIDGSEVGLDYVVPTERQPGGAPLDIDVLDQMTRNQLAFYEELLGPYPFERYGLAMLSEGIAGLGMETQGRSLFNAPDFVRNETSGFAQAITAHEVAHQWFGNSVSPGQWQDIWLNESLTTYAEWLWMDEIGETQVRASAASALSRRQVPTLATGAPDVSEMFSSEVYGGGAAVVHSLRLLLGDDVFFEVYGGWTQEFADGVATTDDFLAFVAERAEAAGLAVDIDAWAEEWLFAPSLPAEYPS